MAGPEGIAPIPRWPTPLMSGRNQLTVESVRAPDRSHALPATDANACHANLFDRRVSERATPRRGVRAVFILAAGRTTLVLTTDASAGKAALSTRGVENPICLARWNTGD